MASLIVPGLAESAGGEPKAVSTVPSSARQFQSLFRESLAVLSRWYDGHGSSAAEGERLELVQLSAAGDCLASETCLSSLRAGTASIATAGSSPDFLSLPVGVHLHIFSFLDAVSLCRLAQTCGHMHGLTSDPLLWARLLERDVCGWSVIGHLSHPQVYREASSDLSPRQIYRQCWSHQDGRIRPSFAHPITGRLRSLVRKIQGHIPRILMFGSGLESVPLVRSMLWEADSPYHPIGLYPGRDGVGSGVCIQHRDMAVNLITLYAATRAEREAAHAGQQARVNRLVSAVNGAGGQRGQREGGEREGGERDTELTPAVQELCRHCDAAILVVDATHLTGDSLRLDLLMLQSVLHANVLQTTPLLVLSCQPPETTDSSTAAADSVIEITNKLQLCDLHQPWQARALVLSQYQSLQAGMDWLLAAANL